MHGNARLLAATLTIAAAASPTVFAEVTVKDPGTFVVDRAGIVDAGTRQNLEGLLLELQKKTSAQVKLVTVATVNGEDWFGWVQRHFDLWKLGQKGKDNGVLIALAVKQRKLRIHPGYGLEHVLPDSWCGSASREAASAFKKERYSDGLAWLTAGVANKVAAASNVKLSGAASFSGYRPPRKSSRKVAVGGGLFPLLVVFIIISSISRRRRHYGRWGGGGLWSGLFVGSMLGNMMGGGRSGWGGGGFGGGGFGGGGFGGGFGGGGMSGGGGGGASW